MRERQRWVSRRTRHNLLTNNGLSLLAAAINGVVVQNQNAGWGYPVPTLNLGDIWGAVGSSQTAATVNDSKLGAELGRAIVANGVSSITQIAWDFFFATTQANGTIWEAGAFLQSVGPPPAPTVTVGGPTGSTTYGYQVVAIGGATNGDSFPSATTTITNGNANLGGANYNVISWQPVPSATGYRVIRVQGGLGGIGTGQLPSVPSTTLTLQDYGTLAIAYTATVSPPGTLLDHAIFASSTTKLSSQTAVLEVQLTLATS